MTTDALVKAWASGTPRCIEYVRAQQFPAIDGFLIYATFRPIRVHIIHGCLKWTTLWKPTMYVSYTSYTYALVEQWEPSLSQWLKNVNNGSSDRLGDPLMFDHWWSSVPWGSDISWTRWDFTLVCMEVYNWSHGQFKWASQSSSTLNWTAP